jgi:hypothetical protein
MSTYMRIPAAMPEKLNCTWSAVRSHLCNLELCSHIALLNFHDRLTWFRINYAIDLFYFYRKVLLR